MTDPVEIAAIACHQARIAFQTPNTGDLFILGTLLGAGAEVEKPWHELAPDKQDKMRSAVRLWRDQIPRIVVIGRDDQATIEDAFDVAAQRLPALLHIRWCDSMISRGWSHAPRFDEAKKTHPWLCPYSDLPGMQHDQDGVVVSAFLELWRAGLFSTT